MVNTEQILINRAVAGRELAPDLYIVKQQLYANYSHHQRDDGRYHDPR